ncbi:hypothetical protein JWG39_05560 [Desulforhopalus vacuolatus]|uniref:hypothetical protein n=1 Tax=Desulforhopalus vacuolatus TaxID=40414 RepID=UPI0019668A7F|nr:hypothetical protein [Desulforhopalus vacuolatus]MBM9519288.1 hypothetical protein [Desulforhopalus vacuolatus]
MENRHGSGFPQCCCVDKACLVYTVTGNVTITVELHNHWWAEMVVIPGIIKSRYNRDWAPK